MDAPPGGRRAASHPAWVRVVAILAVVAIVSSFVAGLIAAAVG